MICPKCNKTIRDQALFCDFCGTKIDKPDNQNDIQISELKQGGNINRKSKTISIIFGVIILLLLIVLVIVLINGNKTDYNANVTPVGTQYASDVVIHWYHIDGENEDDYNVYTPYIENGYLYIPIEAQINTSYTVQYRGFGTASINDTFSKTVPFQYEYEKSTVTKGKYQKLTLRVPVNDLDVQKPTTLYCQLATYMAGNQKSIQLEFDISW